MNLASLLVVTAGAIVVPAASQSQVPAGTADASKTPAQVARSLADHGAIVLPPPHGKAKASIRKEDATFELPEGRSSARRGPEVQHRRDVHDDGVQWLLGLRQGL